jgi:AraC-like DNA-binding protein
LDSFFFNIIDTGYKVDKERVDISNGIVFFDIKKPYKYQLKNLDRFIMIVIVKSGTSILNDHINNQCFIDKSGDSTLYVSARQDATLKTTGEVFILFIADFFLKRYLSYRENEPIDMLYHLMQKESSFIQIGKQSLDALSLYIIDKITQQSDTMQGIRCEHNVIELMIHRFSLIDTIEKNINKEELAIAKKAKAQLLKSFANPPTIQDLAHLCATNENKLKKVFKKVYKTTIYSYIQKLRLNEANLLLKDKASTIGEIAKAVGYKHQGHFSKLFFETYGIYPKELLKK